MAGSCNGIGTTYYGADDRQFDSSFVTTEWFIILFVPLIPVGSYGVRLASSANMSYGNVRQTFRTYAIIRRLPLNIKQVIKIYAIVGAVLVQRKLENGQFK